MWQISWALSRNPASGGLPWGRAEDLCMELFVLMPLTNGRTWEQPAIPLGSVFGLHSHDEAT